MKNYTDLISRLRSINKRALFSAIAYDAADAIEALVAERLDRHRDEGQAMTRPKREIITWVDVSERLPDDDITVLVVEQLKAGRTWFGYYDCGWRRIDGWPIEVSHWSHLPAGPATKEAA